MEGDKKLNNPAITEVKYSDSAGAVSKRGETFEWKAGMAIFMVAPLYLLFST